jgi:alcohol sulfotransferase
MLRWMGETPEEAEVKGAVDFASFDNLKQLEAKDAFSGGTKRLTPGDASNPDSFKVRRAKVGGFRDYFDDEQVRQIEAYIRGNLAPSFGYEVTVS